MRLKNLKDNMKCEQIISTWYSTGMGSKVNKIVCGGEMIEVGKIDTGKKDASSDGEGNAWLRDVKVTLYQCESCKTIKLA